MLLSREYREKRKQEDNAARNEVISEQEEVANTKSLQELGLKQLQRQAIQ